MQTLKGPDGSLGSYPAERLKLEQSTVKLANSLTDSRGPDSRGRGLTSE